MISDTARIIDSDISDKASVWKNTYVKNCQMCEKSSLGDDSRAENSSLGKNVLIQRGNLMMSANIGDYTYTGRNSTFWNCEIGKFCSISWNVSIGGANHDVSKITTHAFLYSKDFGMVEEPLYNRFDDDCRIGNDVWIGAGAIICRGVKVGDGAVIGAGAVVTHDVPPYAIVAGVPAKILRYRFSEDVIARFLQIKWWNLPSEIIAENVKLFNETPSEEKLAVIEKLCEEYT